MVLRLLCSKKFSNLSKVIEVVNDSCHQPSSDSGGGATESRVLCLHRIDPFMEDGL